MTGSAADRAVVIAAASRSSNSGAPPTRATIPRWTSITNKALRPGAAVSLINSPLSD